MTEPLNEQSGEQKIVEVHSTSCCIVGGGPAGLMLATLLAIAAKVDAAAH